MSDNGDYPPEVIFDRDKHIYDIGWTESFINMYDIFQTYRDKYSGNLEVLLEKYDNFMEITRLKASGASANDMITVAELRNDPELADLLRKFTDG